MIRPRAQIDISKIWRYTYNNWGEKQADVYTEGLGQIIDSVIDNPEIGMAIDHVREGYRLYHFEHHFIIYSITKKEIVVARILGESMDITLHF